MTSNWAVLGFTSLGMIPVVIVLVLFEKQGRLIQKSSYIFFSSLGLILATSAIYHWFGECTFFEAVAMQKRCSTMLLPGKSILIFYGGAILGLIVFFFSVIKTLQQSFSKHGNNHPNK